MKRLPTTPRSQVRSAIRRLWLRSRERAAALKRDKYSCVECHKKKSKAKGREVRVEVHHLDGIDWSLVVEYIYRHVLVSPDKLEVRCEDCHKKMEAK